MAGNIQRQSILSTIVIYVGFGFGALNLLFLPNLIGKEYYGLTRVVNEFSFIAAYFATMGSQSMVAKFLPFYRHYLPSEKNDLPFIATVIAMVGGLITLVLLIVLKPWIIIIFGRNNPIFSTYYWTIIPYTFLVLAFLLFEPIAWHAGKTVIGNILKETVIRILPSILILLLVFKWIDTDQLIGLYAFLYLIPVVVGWSLLLKWKAFPIHFKISSVTKRLKGRMFAFSGFLFLTTVIRIASQVADTLFLGSMKGFGYAGQFAIAQYFGSVLEVPNRAIMGSAVPVLAEYWRTKNLHGIQSIYRKSAMNLMIAGILFGGLIVINLRNILHFFPPDFTIIIVPAIIIIVSKLVDLGTGLNAQIIQTSNHWKFDFYSTLIYSLVSIPLNFFLIRTWGIIGAAMANLLANVVYNSIRWNFLYRRYRLHPFGLRNLELAVMSALLVTAVWFVPEMGNVFIDLAVRSGIFIVLFCGIVLQRRYSDEMQGLWVKYSGMAMAKLGRKS